MIGIPSLPVIPAMHALDPASGIGDLFAVPAPDDRRYDLLAVGDTGVDLMLRVDQMPGRDDKVIGEHLGIFGGGMTANFAAAAMRAAPLLDVTLVSRVGSDAFGAQCLADLNHIGVDTSHVAVQPGGVTWWCAVALDASGEKSLLGGRTSASLPWPEDLSDEIIAATRWMHILGDVPFARDAIERASAGNAVTSVDIEGSFATTDPAQAGWLASSADLAVINSSGLWSLTHDDDVLAAAVALLDSNGPRVRGHALLVTLGSAGSMFVHRDAQGRWSAVCQPAALVDVVDSTGAGDSFAGTFIGTLLDGHTVAGSLAVATAAAALTLGHLGARPHQLRALSTSRDLQEESAHDDHH
jgi:ribokinase